MFDSGSSFIFVPTPDFKQIIAALTSAGDYNITYDANLD